MMSITGKLVLAVCVLTVLASNVQVRAQLFNPLGALSGLGGTLRGAVQSAMGGGLGGLGGLGSGGGLGGSGGLSGLGAGSSGSMRGQGLPYGGYGSGKLFLFFFFSSLTPNVPH